MKQDKPGMANKLKSVGRSASGLTQPGELYLPGDALPLPEVVEKDTDSVWALWSDMVEGDAAPMTESDKDFKETIPMDFDALEQTQAMGLPDRPNGASKKR